MLERCTLIHNLLQPRRVWWQFVQRQQRRGTSSNLDLANSCRHFFAHRVFAPLVGSGPRSARLILDRTRACKFRRPRQLSHCRNGARQGHRSATGAMTRRMLLQLSPERACCHRGLFCCCGSACSRSQCRVTPAHPGATDPFGTTAARRYKLVALPHPLRWLPVPAPWVGS